MSGGASVAGGGPWRDRTVLLLLPGEANDFLDAHAAHLDAYCGEVIRLDYTAAFLREGCAGLERRIRSLVAERRVDAVFACLFATDHELSVEFFASLKSATRVVFWFFDDDNSFHAYSKHYAQAAHAVTSTDSLYVRTYRHLGIPAVLYYSSYDKDDYPAVEVERDIDVSFVGNCDKNDRAALLAFLREHGVAVRAFGRGSPDGFLGRRQVPAVFSRSKINLNFSRIDALNWVNDDEPLLERQRQNKGRVIEIALTGSFCLTEHAPGLGEMFEVGREVDEFRDREELLAKVRHYLGHPEERRRLAANARARALACYEKGVYIPRVLAELDAALFGPGRPGPGREGIRLSAAFKRKAINGLAFSLLLLAARGRPGLLPGHALRLFRYGPRAFLAGVRGGFLRALRTRWRRRPAPPSA